MDGSKESAERFAAEKEKLHSAKTANEERGEKLVGADFGKFLYLKVSLSRQEIKIL